MKCIFAEKPSVAGEIAAILGAHERKDGYFIGSDYIVTFGFGHLITLKDSVDYDPKYEDWKLEYFPFIPDRMEYKVKDDSGIKKQFKIISELFNRPDVEVIYNFGDPDREGELVFYLIAMAARVSKPIKRIWITERTPKDIQNGLKEMKDSSEYINLQSAALARQVTDWLVGINLTSVATVSYSRGKVLNLGRLIIAILKLVYDRDNEIKTFVPKTNFQLKAKFITPSNEGYSGYYFQEDVSLFPERELLDNISASIEGLHGIVISKEVSIEKKGPKRLFSLSDLQGYITDKYNGWSAVKVLKIAQALYEKKYLTYPRTASNFLEENLKPRMKSVLEAVTKGTEFESLAVFSEDSKIFNSKKVVAHSALTPTYIVPDLSSLTADEAIIYEEVKKRFISHFMPLSEYEKTEIITQVSEHQFLTSGKVLIKDGWLHLYKKDADEVESETDLLPVINENQDVLTEKCEVLLKKTTAPPHYTVNGLLNAMKSCGQNVEDTFENVLQGFEIGTEATRAEGIAKVLDVGYIEQKGKSLYVTEMGSKLVELVPLGKLLDVNFTGQIEKNLRDIENGKASKDDFLIEIKKLVISVVENMKAEKIEICKEQESLGKCPECGNDIIETDLSYSCSDFKNGCKFCIWKGNKLLEKNGVKAVSKQVAMSLLSNRKSNLFINFTKLIIITLQRKDERWDLSFEFPSKEETLEYLDDLGKCPNCGSKVIETLHGYSCSKNFLSGVPKDGETKACNFFVGKENKFLESYKIKKLSKQVLKGLLSKGKVQIKVSPTFNIFAVLERSDGRYNVRFEVPSKEENLALREVIGKCPECGKDVFESTLGFTCSGYIKDDPVCCKFSLFKEDKFFAKYKKKINKSMAKAFLKNGQADVKDLYSENKDKNFDATILMEKNGKYYNFKFKF